MIGSAQYPVRTVLVEQLRGQGQSGLEALCKSAARSACVTVEETYPVLAELMTLDIVQLHPVATVQGDPEPQAVVSIDHVGYDLYRCLGEVIASTRTLSCAATMLFIVNSCGMATKNQLFQRLHYVKGARRYSYMHLSVQLRALVIRGHLVMRRDDMGITLFAISKEGRHKVSRCLKHLGYTGTINISMGE